MSFLLTVETFSKWKHFFPFLLAMEQCMFITPTIVTNYLLLLLLLLVLLDLLMFMSSSRLLWTIFHKMSKLSTIKTLFATFLVSLLPLLYFLPLNLPLFYFLLHPPFLVLLLFQPNQLRILQIHLWILNSHFQVSYFRQ